MIKQTVGQLVKPTTENKMMKKGEVNGCLFPCPGTSLSPVKALKVVNLVRNSTLRGRSLGKCYFANCKGGMKRVITGPLRLIN